MRILLAIFFLAGLAKADPPAPTWTLYWYANPPAEAVTGYWVWRIEGTNALRLAATSGTNWVLVKPGCYAVSATNSAGESPLSAQACTLSPPGGVRVQAVITITSQ